MAQYSFELDMWKGSLDIPWITGFVIEIFLACSLPNLVMASWDDVAVFHITESIFSLSGEPNHPFKKMGLHRLRYILYWLWNIYEDVLRSLVNIP